ncbi:MAG: hypothetical protein DDT39_01046 [Firmicutes bacterium]|nr:hypothetical protein [candidate division NPL-UPA2 bacterium]
MTTLGVAAHAEDTKTVNIMKASQIAMRFCMSHLLFLIDPQEIYSLCQEAFPADINELKHLLISQLVLFVSFSPAVSYVEMKGGI